MSSGDGQRSGRLSHRASWLKRSAFRECCRPVRGTAAAQGREVDRVVDVDSVPGRLSGNVYRRTPRFRKATPRLSGSAAAQGQHYGHYKGVRILRTNRRIIAV